MEGGRAALRSAFFLKIKGNACLLFHHLLDHFPPSSVERSLAELPGCPSLPIGDLPEAPRRPARGYGTPWQPRTREVLQRAILALLLGYEGDTLVCGSFSRGAGRRAWSHGRGNCCLLSTRRQHKTTLGVPKPLRIYLQVAIQMSYHYLEVNSKRLGGRCRMGLGAVNAAPCVHGRRSARGAVNKRPQAAARANHRRHSAPLRAPHRVGAIHYATRSAPAPRTQGAASSAGGTIYTPHHGAPKHMA